MSIKKGDTISIDAGHNAIGDTGAVGIKVEDELTKELTKIIITKLNEIGVNVVDCTPYDKTFNSVSESLAFRVNMANASNSILHLCIHFNKFDENASGTECYVDIDASKSSTTFANEILNELVALGFINRGVKLGNLYIPKYTKMPCVLIEGCFIDNIYDMKLLNLEIMAISIIKGITGINLSILESEKPIIKYISHVENIGWMNWVSEGEISGTVGKSLRMEALAVLINGVGKLEIQGHVEGIGWQSVRTYGEIIGTIGKGLRLEAVKIWLLGVSGYKVQYQSHVEGIGWQPYVEGGEISGTTGKSLRIEAIRIKLVNM